MNNIKEEIAQEAKAEAVKPVLETAQAAVEPPVKRKRGRPRKADIEAKKNRGKVGRPVGDAGRIKEFKARLLATTGDKVINKIVQVAMDDTHSGQMAALKMCMDRVLPLSYFEKDKNGGGSGQISINITGVGDVAIGAEKKEDIEGEYTDVEQ